jgi:hypothetical protein
MYLENEQKWVDSGKVDISLVQIIELLIPCILHFENCIGEKS